jgi:hypothetical protein
MCFPRRSARAPTKTEERTPAPIIDGENDIATLPFDLLRQELIRYHYHPSVVNALPDFAVTKCIRELHGHRITGDWGSHGWGTDFRGWGAGSHPLFGSSAQPNPDDFGVQPQISAWQQYPRTVVAYPRMGNYQMNQPLQTNVDSQEPQKEEEPLPEILPLDLNAKLLNCGVLQSTIDELSSEKLGEIVKGFGEGLSPEEVVAAARLRIGNTTRVITDSQLVDTEREVEEDEREGEDDPRKS